MIPNAKTLEEIERATLIYIFVATFILGLLIGNFVGQENSNKFFLSKGDYQCFLDKKP